MNRVCSTLSRSMVWSSIVLTLGGCAAAPPKTPDNVCSVFEQKQRWWKEAKRVERRWGVPPSVSMAFVHRESSYVANAKPPRRRKLGFIPWGRISSAYGYAQATDETWADYKRASGRRFADRDDFGDALDFIGWYNAETHRQLGISLHDARHLYLAYHEGRSGYRSGRWRKKQAVKRYADKVAHRSASYEAQLKGCRKALDRGWWIF